MTNNCLTTVHFDSSINSFMMFASKGFIESCTVGNETKARARELSTCSSLRIIGYHCFQFSKC